MIMLFTVMMVLVLPTHAQGGSHGTLTFNHIALHVKDLDKSAAFYGRSLNLSELSRESRTGGVRWFSLGEGKELHLISPEYFNGAAVQTNKAAHLATTADRFKDLLIRLDSLGIPHGDWTGRPRAIRTRSVGVERTDGRGNRDFRQLVRYRPLNAAFDVKKECARRGGTS